MNIFSDKKVNLGRQTEVDLLRGFTAVIIVVCHVGLYLGDPASTGLYTFCDIIGSEFAAPVFMALMGIGLVYSGHQSPPALLKRGVRLFLMGYALSFYRSILPLLIGGAMDEWASVEAFFVVDILQFAGLSFMFFSLLKKLRLPSPAIPVLSVVMVLLDQRLMLPASVPWDSEWLTGLVNLFCPVTDWSCFPFLTWFFFPAFGLVFGDVLTHCVNKKKLYAVLLPAGLLGVLYVYYRFYCLYPDYTSYYYGHNFYYMGLKNVLLTALFICFALAFWFFAGKILPAALKRFLIFLSRNLNPFYISTWLVISLLIHWEAIYERTLGTAACIGLMVLLTAVCAGMTKAWIAIKAARRKPSQGERG